jgi:type IX secretion system PorP/SprF family membrane protein
MTMMKIKILIAFSILANCNVMAQQEGIMGQLIMNKMTLNPGYTGYRERPVFTIAHRKQWAGFAGAPSTSIITYDRPMSKNELAVGASMEHTKIGPTSKSDFNTYFSVRTRLNNRSTISWGLTAGMQLFQANLMNLRNSGESLGQQDDLLITNSRTELIPQIGVGCYYFSQASYFGISIPKLVRSRSLVKSDFMSNPSIINQKTLYLMAGKSQRLQKSLYITYNGFAIASPNSPISVGSYFTAVYNQKYTFGGYYIFAQNAGVLFQCELDRTMKIGYSFDLSTNAIIRTNFGSHELNFNYYFKNKVKRATYPRLF